MKGGEDNPEKELRSYIDDTTGNIISNNCEIDDDKCFKPNSKSDQKINICTSKVYKGPSKGFKRVVESDEKKTDKYVKIDPQTMNLLVQTVIKKIAPNRNIEQYDSICHDDNKYEYALVGKKFSSNKDMTGAEGNIKRKAISVEEYIEAINKEGDTADKQNECNKIIGWLRSVFENLDFLFEKIQFHHCDPKAAQLLVDGDTVILGDLDKVTFTLNIEQTPYRMRLSWGNAVKNTLKNKSGYNYVKKKLGYGGAYLKSSEPENMRFESYPRTTNDFEKAAFMASILLQLNDNLYQVMVRKIKEDSVLKTIYNFIDESKLDNNRTKPKKTGHAIASECVTQIEKTFNVTLKSNASLVEKKDGDLVIEYNWW